ncbi:MAG: hypothetical protein M3430_22025 [Acidobacteriota bacterium]|nr:hypothetical protein [Acidobacteriota bacterium]
MLKALTISFLSKARTRAAQLAIGAATIGLILGYLQFSTSAICCGDYDGYYHVRWSRMLWEGLRQGQFPPAFTSLPLTTLDPKNYVDHHLLFHILQIPFTWFGDLRFGAKVGAWLFSTLGVFACYALIVHYRIRYPLLWLIALFAGSNAFLFRINMTKAMSVSLVLMIAGIHVLFQRKYIWLVPLAFLYVWTYSLWVMLGVAAVIWTGVVFWSERRLDWEPVVWTGLGAILGFVVNPYFPENIVLFYEHVSIKATAGGFSTNVGGEWYPFNSWEFLINCLVAFAAMVVGYVAFNNRDGKSTQRTLFFLVFSTVLLIANARSRRWSEYWPPFAVLFAAFALQPFLERILSRTRSRLIGHSQTNGIDELPHRGRRWVMGGALAAVIIALGAGAVRNVNLAAKEIEGSAPPEQFQAAMEWVRGNVPKGELIFNTSWDHYPKIFYYNTSNSYVSGLDPTYLLNKDPDLAKLYDRITLGQEENPGLLIRERFGARYVITDGKKTNAVFYHNAVNSGWFEEVYDDQYCTVLHVLDVRALLRGGEVPIRNS